MYADRSASDGDDAAHNIRRATKYMPSMAMGDFDVDIGIWKTTLIGDESEIMAGTL